MGRPKINRNHPKNRSGVSLRLLKKELKLIPNHINREMRFLDLLFAERNISRTQAEREVLKEFIERSKAMVEYHQDRLERYQRCYDQLKAKKAFDLALLLPGELQFLQGETPSQAETPQGLPEREGLRTGTDG